MKKIFGNKNATTFGLIGALTGGVFILIYDLGIFHSKSFLSTSNQIFDPIFLFSPFPDRLFLLLFDETKYDPTPFFIGFGIIALALGLYYAEKQIIIENEVLNNFLMVTVFTLCGFAFSFWLHLYQVAHEIFGGIPFYSLIVSFAVGLFVFIFSATFLGLPNNREALSKSPLLVLLLPVLFVIGPPFNFSTLVTLGLVCCLLVLAIVYITVEYHYREYFNNIVINILLLMLALSVIPTVGLITIPISNLYFLLGMSKQVVSEKKGEASISPKFKKRITVTFEWLFALPSVLLNYTVIGSFFSIVPYWGITKYLQETQQLTLTNFSRSLRLGLFAFLVYALFFFYYQAIRPSLSLLNAYLLLTADVLAWSAICLLGSQAIGYSLFVMKNEQ